MHLIVLLIAYMYAPNIHITYTQTFTYIHMYVRSWVITARSGDSNIDEPKLAKNWLLVIVVFHPQSQA